MSRPITGSMSPSVARAVRSTQNIARALFSFFFWGFHNGYFSRKRFSLHPFECSRWFTTIFFKLSLKPGDCHSYQVNNICTQSGNVPFLSSVTTFSCLLTASFSMTLYSCASIRDQCRASMALDLMWEPWSSIYWGLTGHSCLGILGWT